jgi:predicted RNA-binding protein with PUA-like domain
MKEKKTLQYWLMKNEPEVYSLKDLRRDKRYAWDGVRNYAARNYLKEMKVGDLVLYYYSSSNPIGVAGVAKVVKEAYPDPTQFDRRSKYFDPKSPKENPRWVAVDVASVSEFPSVLTLQELKHNSFFEDMLVVKKGMRLSVQPVAEKHFNKIVKLGE